MSLSLYGLTSGLKLMLGVSKVKKVWFNFLSSGVSVRGLAFFFFVVYIRIIKEYYHLKLNLIKMLYGLILICFLFILLFSEI